MDTFPQYFFFSIFSPLYHNAYIMSWQTFLINNLANLALHDGGNLVAIFFVYSMMRATFGKLCPLLIFGQRGHLLISCAPLGHSFNFAWLPKHSVVAAGIAENSRGLKYKLKPERGCDILLRFSETSGLNETTILGQFYLICILRLHGFNIAQTQ